MSAPTTPATATGPEQAIPFARTEIGPQAQQAALAVLRSGWVTTGPLTAEFELALAGWTGARYAVAVSSCTAALELSLRALRLPAGAPVLTPSLTFCGAVQAIVHAGLRPVLTDVDPVTLVPSPEAVAQAVARTGRPAAMVLQHQAGFPVERGPLAEAAGIDPGRVVDDAAHGLAARYPDGSQVGSTGRAVCLSFYATKNLPIGEGGAVLTDDPALAEAVGRARLHGMSRDSWARYRPGGSWRYTVDDYGLKANFTDLQAAIGLAQLERLAGWQRRREQIAARYDRNLAGTDGLALPARPEAGGHAWHLYQVRLAAAAGWSRDDVVEKLADRGIGTSVHFVPVDRMPYFRRVLGPQECAAVPVTDAASDELLSLPMHPGLSDDEVDRVAEALLSLAPAGGGR